MKVQYRSHLIIMCLSYAFSSHIYAETATEATTAVYKVVAPDGSISFSDQPQERAELIQVKPIHTVPAFTAPVSSSQSEPEKDSPVLTYREFSFMAPANDTAFYSGSGDVEVMLTIEPKLRTGDQIQLFLNNKLIVTGQETQHLLKTLDRGAHQLSARIINGEGNVLQQTNSAFTVHRPGIKK